MNLKIKLTLQKIHSTTNILIFEKRVKDLIKKFKKIQFQIHGLDLSLKNTTKQFEKDKSFKNISIADHWRRNIYIKSSKLQKKV